MKKRSNFTGAPRTMREAWFQSSPMEPGAAIERPEPRPGRSVAKWFVWSVLGFLALVAISWRA